MAEQTRYVKEGVARYYPFAVTVSGGTGSILFPLPVSGKVFHRQIVPPNEAAAFVYYFSNSDAVSHDVHSVTGTVDCNDIALLIAETRFYIVNATVDGTYLVYLWIEQ